jgi:hypothetical protein
MHGPLKLRQGDGIKLGPVTRSSAYVNQWSETSVPLMQPSAQDILPQPTHKYILFMCLLLLQTLQVCISSDLLLIDHPLLSGLSQNTSGVDGLKSVTSSSSTSLPPQVAASLSASTCLWGAHLNTAILFVFVSAATVHCCSPSSFVSVVSVSWDVNSVICRNEGCLSFAVLWHLQAQKLCSGTRPGACTVGW